MKIKYKGYKYKIPKLFIVLCNDCNKIISINRFKYTYKILKQKKHYCQKCNIN